MFKIEFERENLFKEIIQFYTLINFIYINLSKF